MPCMGSNTTRPSLRISHWSRPSCVVVRSHHMQHRGTEDHPERAVKSLLLLQPPVLAHLLAHLEHDLLSQRHLHLLLQVAPVEQQRCQSDGDSSGQPTEEGAEADALNCLDVSHVRQERVPWGYDVLALLRLLDEARADGAGHQVSVEDAAVPPAIYPQSPRRPSGVPPLVVQLRIPGRPGALLYLSDSQGP
eukprot:UN1427